MSLTKTDLKAIKDIVDTSIDEKLEEKLEEKLDEKIDELARQTAAGFHEMTERFNRLETKFDEMEERLNNSEENAGHQMSATASLRKRQNNHEKRIQRLELKTL